MTELSKDQQAELVQAAQTAGARGDGFDQFWANVQAEVDRLRGNEPPVEPKLTAPRQRDIV